MPPSSSSAIETRVNVFGSPLLALPSEGPISGFFRNGFCDASQMDPASHTVAAILSPNFLLFSASQGNDLRPLFPTLPRFTSAATAPSPFPICLWCICASRFKEALIAAETHPLGEAIVPRLILESTHERALKDISMADLERFAIGGDGDGKLEGGGSGGIKVQERPGR